MALLHSFEKSGNYLFRNRGRIPAVLFITVVPVIYFTGYSEITGNTNFILSGLSIIICMAGFFVRAIAIGTTPKGTSGRNTETQVAETLNSTGIYSIVRHPLYLGNYLMWLGIVMFTFNVFFVIIISLAFWLYYERIMFAEERYLERKFGEDYMSWSNKIPAFIPRFHLYTRSEIPFSVKSVFRREYSGVLAAAVSFAFIDCLRFYVVNREFQWLRISTVVLVIIALITLILRTLKHNTRLLDEEGRS